MTHSSLANLSHTPTRLRTLCVLTLCLTLWPGGTKELHAQGTLTPPGAPAPTMKSLAQIEPRTLIATLPFIITNSGSYYLAGNLTGSVGAFGITISSGNVTLDLNGFTLAGVPGANSGISLTAGTNVTIRNGNISGWPADGVFTSAPAMRNFLIERVNFSGNGSGLSVFNALIVNCTINGSTGDGIQAFSSTVRDCSVDGNGGSGIYLSPGNALHCLVQRSGQHGIHANSSGCVITENICRGNNTLNSVSNAGIYVNDSNNRVENNQVAGSGGAGSGIGGGINFSGNVIVKNYVSGFNANNYAITGTQVVGPIINSAGTITNASPWANFSF